MTNKSLWQKFIDRFTRISIKIGNQIHLRSLRDAFAMIMPLFILAGLGVLINNVFFPLFLKGTSLANFQTFGNLIVNGTLNIAGLIIAPVVGYCLARNRNYKNALGAAIVSLAGLIVVMPVTLQALPINGKKDVDISGFLSYSNIGVTGMFAGIIIGLIAAELFIKLSKIEKIKINLGENVPPAVSESFLTLIPTIAVISLLAIISAILFVGFHTDLIKLITTLIQEPLRRVNTSLPGFLLIYSVGNLLFGFGIHQAVINGTLLDPVLLINTNKNMQAFAAGDHVPYIITSVFRDTFGMMGGTGSTICLLVATFLFSRVKASREVTKLSIVPGIFNINEPVIYGYPIVFNIPLLIPFVLTPIISLLIAYYATVLGLMNKTVVLVPWTTPPLINGFLATGGDWRAVVVQLLSFIIGVLFYIPFMKISEQVLLKQNQA
ncbi:PTS sugar transporter subunit IIC [Leuconostoc gasicomitatum]|uniref:Permease IIC component n=1 Tax=Leuconostoc gasicomitatum TaxID=115778 RepID=A0A9Q3SWV9_9LACO|nr:PTS transporter subunit EIIC [Leuconostoc gasicomitatum]MBZ5952444.1 PTS sugar transporter subunit IIC [Leuconostoc gasicomitatum]MBZ5962440.1 PTS sugar transporter subunit IIC [Leuconostoc gasicomitatum]MBZ5988875.1 PTS sugar transporter subunit IIC [Leuconostoc gasicomitatum]MBZ5990703.1 PTS sugar transporter subunit IIC [Leuconostoc gasicomitatum]CUR64482.1 PTS system lactose/cellobiose specific IIC subunit [Leuconostoc gasicomitatum KG16-1]